MAPSYLQKVLGQMEDEEHLLTKSWALDTARPYCICVPEVATSAQGSPDPRWAHIEAVA